MRLANKLTLLLAAIAWLHPGSAVADLRNPNTDWFSQAKYGVFVHFLPSGDGFEKRVNEFDVDAFAQDCQEAGAAYVTFTLGQDGYYCSPNATYERFAGYAVGQRCSTRDLPMELHAALGKKGIKLMLYINGDVPVSDEKAAKGLGATERGTDKSNWAFNDTLVERWAAVMGEWADRYGDKVAGWWVDGCYSYNGYTTNYAQVFCKALKHGNAASIVAVNPGVGMGKIADCQDYTAGESDDQFQFNTMDQVCTNRWTAGVQWHELAYLGSGWGSGDPRFTADQVIPHLKQDVVANGGVFTMDVRLNRDFTGDRIHPTHLELLRTVKTAIRVKANEPGAKTSHAAGGKEYTSPANGSCYALPITNYTLWIPEGVTNVRGIILTQNYHAGMDIYTSDALGYRDLARKYNLAIMVGQVINLTTADAEKARNDLLNNALPDFAAKSGHPEIKFACFIPMGLSWGGDTACYLTSVMPERIITYVPLHSTDNLTTKLDDLWAFKAIPSLSGTAVTLETRAKVSQANTRAGALICNTNVDPFIAFLDGHINVWDDTTPPLCPFKANTWYDFKMVINTEAKKYDVYVDGALQRSGVDYKHTNVTGITLGYVSAGSISYERVKISKDGITYLDENFGDTPVGSPPAGWVCANDAGTIVVVSDPNTTNKYCRFTKADAPNLDRYLAVPGLSEEADRDNFMQLLPQVDSVAWGVMPMREKGALVAGYIMKDTAHPWVANQAFNQLWIKTILNLRVPEIAPTNSLIVLTNLVESSGYLGRLDYHKQLKEKDNTLDHVVIDRKEIYSYSAFPFPKPEGHWLPNAEVAEAWLQMLTDRTVPASCVDWMPSASKPGPVEFHVSKQGSGNGLGTSDQPLATLEDARDSVRKQIAKGLSSDVRVVIHSGTYNLTDTLVFGPSDCGTTNHTVNYEAAPGDTVILNGARRITAWAPTGDSGLWSARAGNLDFRQLYVNGQRAIRARTPNRTNDANMGPFFRMVSWGKSDLVVKAADLAGTKSFDGVEIVVNSHWHHKRLRIESVKVEGDLATITPKAPERAADFFGHFANGGDPFYLENAVGILDTPGEWFLDSRAQVIYYLPRPGEDMETAEVVAPTVETLVRIQGTPEAPVTNLRFEGIHFEHSTWLAPSREGLVDNQSMVEEGGWGWLNGPASTRPNPGAVELRYARGVTLEGCTFKHLGCHGIVLSAPTAHSHIARNTFADISAGAIVVNPTTERDGLPSDHDSITDNTITRCGQDYTSACGIIATYAAFLTIEHNELFDLPYTGISIGWGWGATPNTTALHDNSVRFNHIHHVMQCHDDGAGIYTLEHQNGTVVSQNYVHDIGRSPWAGDYVNAGIYFDNGSSFITAERNVVENVFDDKFVKVQDQPKADTTHDLTLKDNDIHDQSIKNVAGPRLPKKDAQSGLEPKALPLRYMVSTKTEPPTHVTPGLLLHIAQSGNDGGDGSTDKPFASLERARDEIRAIRGKAGMPKGGVTVLVHGGDYAVSRTFTLTAEDSGIDGAPVRYCAVPGQKAAFQGGIRLGGWKQLNDTNLYPLLPRTSIGKVWYMDMKSIGLTNPMPLSDHSPAHELFFNDTAMQLARGPNEGFLHIAGVAVTNLDHGAGAYDTRPSSKQGVFTYNSALPDKWATEPDLLLYGYWFWGWSEAYQRVERVDRNKRTITLAKPWHENGFSVDAPFYAYNALTELDAPGEWYMDRVNGRILIYPPSDVQHATVHLSTFASALVEMENVSNVRFEGLTWEFGSADAIHVKGGTNCLFAGCTIRHFAGNALEVLGGSKHGVLSCDIYSMGGRGIWLEGGDRKTLVPSGHFAENCDIHNLSRLAHTYTPAVWLEGVGNQARHNRLHDIASSAIRLGGNDHLIEYNEIYSVVTESDDQGGIDMWNDATYRGNVFRFNYWHHIGNWKQTGELPRCGQCAIRLDDGICDALIQGSIFERCSAGTIIGFGAVQINGGKDHVIENNLFVDCMAMISESAWDSNRWREYTKSTLDRMFSRDLYFEKYPAMKNLADDANLNHVRNNRSIRCGEQFRAHYGAVLNNLKATNNVTLPMETTFTPKTDNPLFNQPGFERIPIEEMGVYADSWRK